MPLQTLTQPPPSGLRGSEMSFVGQDWVDLGWVTSEDPSQPPHRGGITKCTGKSAPPLFGAKQEDLAWKSTTLGGLGSPEVP